MKLVSVSITFVLLLTSLAQAGVSNGTFNPPLAPAWDAYTEGIATIAVDGAYGTAANVLHMSASTSYQWNSQDGGWYRISDETGMCSLMQTVSIPAGAIAVNFDASAWCTGASLVGSQFGQNPSALVSITYQGLDGSFVTATGSVRIGASGSAGLSSYSILIDAVTDSLADISIDVTTRLDIYEMNALGLTTTDVAMNAWFDNVTFATPEPVTMALLAVGLPLIIRRRLG